MSAGIQRENIEILKRTVEVFNTSTVSSFGTTTNLLQKAISLSNGYERKIIDKNNNYLIILSFYSKSETDPNSITKTKYRTVGLPILELKNKDLITIKNWLIQSLNIDELYTFMLSKGVVDQLFESLINTIIQKVIAGIYTDNDRSLLRQAMSSLGRTYISKRF